MTLRTSIAALAPLFLAAHAYAATKGEIRQIDTARNMAAIQTKARVAVGENLIATSRDNTQCSLTVRSVNGTLATVDTSACSFASQLRVGQTVETSMIAPPAPRRTTAATARPSNPEAAPVASGSGLTMATLKEVAPEGETMGITLFAFYDNNDKVKGTYNGPDGQGGSLSASNTANSESGFGVGAEYAQFAYRSIGYYANGAYEFGRDWKSQDFQGQKTNFSPKPTLTMFLVGAGGNVLINNNVYVKGGVNYNLPSLSSGGGITDVTGKLGFEGGVGFRFARTFNAELLYRRLNMTASGNNQAGSFTIDDVQQTGFVLRGGYVF